VPCYVLLPLNGCDVQFVGCCNLVGCVVGEAKYLTGAVPLFCSARLRYWMEYCETHPDELSKVAAVQKKVDEVKNIMVDNIERVLERGEKIELLVDKTDNLRFQVGCGCGGTGSYCRQYHEQQ
jgi:hypothetical protein